MSRDEDQEREFYQRELRLMRPTTRRSRAELEDLMAADFVEFTSSGDIYDREAVILALGDEQPVAWSIADFKVTSLDQDAALVTYVAMMAGGKSSLRSSIWRREGTRWKMAFHQGTMVKE